MPTVTCPDCTMGLGSRATCATCSGSGFVIQDNVNVETTVEPLPPRGCRILPSELDTCTEAEFIAMISGHCANRELLPLRMVSQTGATYIDGSGHIRAMQTRVWDEPPETMFIPGPPNYEYLHYRSCGTAHFEYSIDRQWSSRRTDDRL